MDIEKLTADLMVEEGKRLKPYLDTRGKLTIGYGRNLTDNGISNAEAEMLLRNDVGAAYAAAQKERWWPAVADNDARARAMVDMVFNMGVCGLHTFKKALEALRARNFEAAADEFQQSNWFREVGTDPQQRGGRLVGMIRTGLTS